MKLFLGGVFVVALLALASPVEAQNTIWSNNGNTSFETQSNWNNGIPTGGYDAYIVPGGYGSPDGSFLVFAGAPTQVSVVASVSHTSDGLFITNDIGETLPTGTVDLGFASGTSYTLTGSLGVSDGETLVYSGNMTATNVNIGGFDGGTFQLATGTLTGGSGSFVIGGSGYSGTVIQAGSSVVLAGSTTSIGQDGTGIYTLQGTSLLETGNDSVVNIGASSASGTGVGTLNLTESSQFTLSATGTLLLGATTDSTSGGKGTINQSGAGSVANLSGSSVAELGATSGGVGVYNLASGTLNISNSEFLIGSVSGASGIVSQSGGTLNDSSSGFVVGYGGTGTYNLSGGNATFNDGFAVGSASGSTGTVSQSGSSVLTANGAVTIGTNTLGGGGFATGVYTISGGTAIFNGTLTNTTHGTINLDGGVFEVNPGSFTDTGTLNFGGGTLKFLSGSGATSFGFTGSLTANTSTLDLSGTSISSFTFTNALTGSGGISLIGNGTVFNLAGGNTFSGLLGISNGTVNIQSTDVANTSALQLGSGGTMNLAVVGSSFSYGGSINGTGLLKVNFQAATSTLTLANGDGANIVLGANSGPEATTTPGTLQLLSGTFSAIAEGTGSTGNNVIIGTSGSSGSVTLASGLYTGTTTVYGGYLLTANSLASSVHNMGTLTVSSNIGANAGTFVTNSGIITAGSIGGSITSNTGTITAGFVAGNLANSGVFTTTGGLNNTSVGGSVTNNGSLFTTAALPSSYSTVLPPASHTTFTIGGNFTQTSPGAITIRIQGGNADFFQVGGATVLNGSVLLARGSSTALGASSFVILNSNGGASGAPTPVSDSALFNFAAANPIVIAGHTVTINTYQQSITQFITPSGPTPNQLAVAHSIDGTSFNVIKSYFNEIPPGPNAAPTMLGALNDLSPQSLQYSRDIAFENSTFLALRMDGIAADLRGGYQGLDSSALSVVPAAFNNSLGQSFSPLFASFHDPAPNGVNYYPGGASSPISGNGSMESIDETGPAAVPGSAASSRWSSSSQVISDTPNPYLAHQKNDVPGSPKLSEFVGGDVILADLNQSPGSQNAPPTKASYTAGDAIAGVSFRMTNNLAAGVLFDYNHTNARTDSNGGKTDVDSYSPGLFATYFDHGFYANGLFSFGYNEYSNDRNINFLGETAHSSPSGQQYVGDLDLGYDVHQDKNWIWGPIVGATYTHLDVDSFSETGAPGADLNVGSQSIDSLRSRIGGHAIYQTLAGDVLLQPNLSLMWQHEYLDNASSITSSFADFTASSFTTQTASPSRDSALISLGLTATLNNSLAFYLNYIADAGSDNFWAQSIVGGIKARF